MDLYEILGVDRTATQEEVKSAWRKKAAKLHPDRNPDTDTTLEFQKLQQAYSVLSDGIKRANYDMYGVAVKPPDIVEEAIVRVFLDLMRVNGYAKQNYVAMVKESLTGAIAAVRHDIHCLLVREINIGHLIDYIRGCEELIKELELEKEYCRGQVLELNESLETMNKAMARLKDITYNFQSTISGLVNLNAST